MPPTTRKQWILDADAFGKLLASFDPDREQAAELYMRTYAKLCTFFEYRGARDADELADETLNRVARRLAEGVSVPTAEIRSYVFGVARNVLRETWGAQGKTQPLDVLPASLEPATDARFGVDDEDARLECLAHCIERLNERDRALIRQYHANDGRKRVDGRLALADQLGIDVNALRIRAFRIRRTLQSCMNKCLERGRLK
jgi:DNA-directed RNA polymerase specialized sigma24 family protein